MASTAVFERVYEDLLKQHKLREMRVSGNDELLNLVNTEMESLGIIHRTRLGVCVYVLRIDMYRSVKLIDYLSFPDDYCFAAFDQYCWLHPYIGAYSCNTCLTAKRNLRCVRAAGYTWLTIDITHEQQNLPRDVKHLIARWLSQFALLKILPG